MTKGDLRRMTPQEADDTFGPPAEPSSSNPTQQPGSEGDTGQLASHTQSTGYSSNRKRRCAARSLIVMNCPDCVNEIRTYSLSAVYSKDTSAVYSKDTSAVYSKDTYRDCIESSGHKFNIPNDKRLHRCTMQVESYS